MESTGCYQLHWQQLHHPLLSSLATDVWLASIHSAIPALSGNKCLKLKYHIQHIEQHQKHGIVSFGGAFSNHLAALAAAGHHFGFATVGLVRTHLPLPSNPTLDFCRHQGMQLQALSRVDYQRRHQPDFLAILQQQFPHYHLVPEGGSDELGIRGAASLDLHQTPAGLAQHLICATGSGGTLAGLATRFPGQVTGIDVVGDVQVRQRLTQWLAGKTNWQLLPCDDNCRYGEFEPATLAACQAMLAQGVVLEPIYTGKAWRSFLSHLAQGTLPAQQRYVFVHSGGLQGLAGLYQRGKIPADYWQASQALLINSMDRVPLTAPMVD